MDHGHIHTVCIMDKYIMHLMYTSEWVTRPEGRQVKGRKAASWALNFKFPISQIYFQIFPKIFLKKVVPLLLPQYPRKVCPANATTRESTAVTRLHSPTQEIIPFLFINYIIILYNIQMLSISSLGCFTKTVKVNSSPDSVFFWHQKY